MCSKHFRAVSEQRTKNVNQRLHEKMGRVKERGGLSLLRNQTETLLRRLEFSPCLAKPRSKLSSKPFSLCRRLLSKLGKPEKS